MSEKSKEIINKIVAAKSSDDAKNIFNDIMDLLNLNENYSKLLNRQRQLEKFQKEFKEIQDSYRENADIHTHEFVNEIRTNCSFLYRDIADELSSPINFSKRYFEESKTTTRAHAREEIISKEEKKRSENLIRDYIGESSLYDQWIKNAALSYANYKELEALLESIRLFTDALSSEAKALHRIEYQDAK